MSEGCEECGCPKEICCGQRMLEWLEKYCKKNMMARYCADRNVHAVIGMKDLLSAAKKEASK